MSDTKYIQTKFSIMWMLASAAAICSAILWTGFQVGLATATLSRLQSQVQSVQVSIAEWDGRISPIQAQLARLDATVALDSHRIDSMQTELNARKEH